MTVATLAHANISRSRCARSEAYSAKGAKKYLAGFLIAAIAIFGFLYVLETNNIAAKDYKISELQKNINGLEATNKSLQIEVSDLKSFNVLEANSGNLEMVKAQKIDYVTLLKSSAMLAK